MYIYIYIYIYIFIYIYGAFCDTVIPTEPRVGHDSFICVTCMINTCHRKPWHTHMSPVLFMNESWNMWVMSHMWMSRVSHRAQWGRQCLGKQCLAQFTASSTLLGNFTMRCCSVLQCVAACCSVLQCVAVCLGVSPCVAVCCSVSQCTAVCRSALQSVAVSCTLS